MNWYYVRSETDVDLGKLKCAYLVKLSIWNWTLKWLVWHWFNKVWPSPYTLHVPVIGSLPRLCLQARRWPKIAVWQSSFSDVSALAVPGAWNALYKSTSLHFFLRARVWHKHTHNHFDYHFPFPHLAGLAGGCSKSSRRTVEWVSRGLIPFLTYSQWCGSAGDQTVIPVKYSCCIFTVFCCWMDRQILFVCFGSREVIV